MTAHRRHRPHRWMVIVASGVILVQVPSCVTDAVNLAIQNVILGITADVLQTVFLNLLHA